MIRNFVADKMSETAARNTVRLTHGGTPHRPTEMSVLEMEARGRQKALGLIFRHRLSEGRNFGNLVAWVSVAADIAGGRFARPTARSVEAVCASIGLPINVSLIENAARRVAAVRLSDGPDFRLMSAEEVGAAIELKAVEREGLGIKRIGSVDETTAHRKARLAKERQANRRARRGSKPRLASTDIKPWTEAKISRSTYYRRTRDTNVTHSVKEGKRDETVSNPTESVTKNPTESVTKQSQISPSPESVTKQSQSTERQRSKAGAATVAPPTISGHISKNLKKSGRSGN